MTQWSIRAVWALALGLCALVAPVHAQEATVKRATDLRESPGDKSASLGALPEQSPVVRTGERQGSWVKVRTSQGKSGWVHMFDLGVQPASASSNSAASGLRGLGGLFGGGSTTTATSTVGIRGLSAEDIANAQPNPAAVGQAEKMRVDAAQARQFASTSALRQRAVAPLPEPPRPASDSSAPTSDSIHVN